MASMNKKTGAQRRKETGFGVRGYFERLSRSLKDFPN
jgi:hypothetical protein